MKKKLKNILKKFNFHFKIYYYIFFILIIGLFINLNNCKIDNKEYHTKQGKIIIIGNEPFTKLSIIDNNKRVYTLKCDKILKNFLLENQGKFVKISYKNKETIGKNTILIVTNVKIIENKKEGNIYE